MRLARNCLGELSELEDFGRSLESARLLKDGPAIALGVL